MMCGVWILLKKEEDFINAFYCFDEKKIPFYLKKKNDLIFFG